MRRRPLVRTHGPRGPWTWSRPGVAAAFCFLATAAAFLPLARNGFVNMDDDVYLYDNPVVAQGLTIAGMRWAFGTFEAANWHPLTWLAHMSIVSLFGMRPGPQHLASLALHAGSTALLMLFLRRATGRSLASLLAALLFGLHPLRVESVAWASELKDTLCVFLWVLTLNAWQRYAARPGVLRYLAALGGMAAALLAKPMAVTLPLTLLLLDWWPLGRFRRQRRGLIAAEKAPFVLLALASAAVAFRAQSLGGAVGLHGSEHLALKATRAVEAYAVYLRLTFLPVDLAAYYPVAPGGTNRWLGAAALLALLSAVALLARRRAPWLALGWCWFVATLVPVIGLVKIGAQSWADRYTYIGHAGLFAAVVWEVRSWVAGRSARARAAVAAGFCVAAVLGVLSWRQSLLWRDSVSLFGKTVQVTGDNWLARVNLAEELLARGDLAGALAHLSAAAGIQPLDPGTRFKLGTVLAGLGRNTEAIAAYRESLRLDPRDFMAHNNLGILLANAGLPEEAVRHYRLALEISPGFASGHTNLAADLLSLGRPEEAIPHYREALRLEPGLIAARVGLQRALTLLQASRPPGQPAR